MYNNELYLKDKKYHIETYRYNQIFTNLLLKYDWVQEKRDLGLYFVFKDNLKGAYDKDGNVIAHCEHKDIEHCNSNTCVKVLRDGGWQLYRNGESISRIYQYIDAFYCKVAAINMGGHLNDNDVVVGRKWGLITEYEKVVLLCDLFNSMIYIGDGLFLASIKDRNLCNEIIYVYHLISETGCIKHIYKSRKVEFSRIKNMLIGSVNNKYGIFHPMKFL